MASDAAHGFGAKGTTDVAGALIALAAAIAFASTTIFLGVMPWMHRLAGSRDFVVYWATGQQLVHHANPFDPQMMHQVEHSTGFNAQGTFYMRNPPWSLPLAFPLGFFGAQAAAVPWSLMLFALLILCGRTLWKMFGAPGSQLDLLAYLFPPGLICVIMGQTSLFLLVGLTFFLRLHKTRPFLAGAALWFCTLKPHLFLPFALVMLIWIVLGRRWQIVAGTATAMVISCLVTLLIDPPAFGQYAQWAAHSGISSEYIPCIAVELRNMIDPTASWLVFVPAALGGIWAIGYFWRRRDRWDWLEHGNVVMLVSLTVAPYCWIYDHSLALPAIMFAAWRGASRRLLAILAVIFIVVETETFLSFWEAHTVYLWIASAWLVWYVLARNSARQSEAPEVMPAVQIPSLG